MTTVTTPDGVDVYDVVHGVWVDGRLFDLPGSKTGSMQLLSLRFLA